VYVYLEKGIKVYINKKAQNVIFHPFAQKPPVNGFVPNLV